MSTRSLIGKLNSDATVEYIHCNFDGNLSWNGAILQSYYQDADKVEALLDLGNLLMLGRELGEQHSSHCRFSNREYMKELTLKGWSSFNLRDCESNVRYSLAVTVPSAAEYLKARQNLFADFVYLFDAKKREGNRWSVYQAASQHSPQFTALKSAILRELRANPLGARILIGSSNDLVTSDEFAPVGVDPVEFAIKRLYMHFGDVSVEIAADSIQLTVFGQPILFPLTLNGADVVRQAREGTLPGPVADESGHLPDFAYYLIEDVRELEARAKSDAGRRR